MTTNDMSDTWMSAELLPCPFCGTAPDVFANGDKDKGFWWTVECNDGCVAVGPMRRTQDEAISAWNTRHPQPVNEPGEMVAALRKAQSAIANCLSAGGVVGSTENPANWWEEIIAAQQSIASALRAASIPKVEPGVKGSPVTLAECPVGLFYAGGELCLKTEYGDNNGRIDAYIVSSGEFFWGGTSTPQEQRKVLVQPFELYPSTSEGEDDEVLYAWLYPYVCDDGQTRILISEMRERFAAPQPAPIAPVPVTITDEMVERLADELWAHLDLNGHTGDGVRKAAQAGLVAALSAKPTGEV